MYVTTNCIKPHCILRPISNALGRYRDTAKFICDFQPNRYLMHSKTKFTNHGTNALKCLPQLLDTTQRYAGILSLTVEQRLWYISFTIMVPYTISLWKISRNQFPTTLPCSHFRWAHAQSPIAGHLQFPSVAQHRAGLDPMLLATWPSLSPLRSRTSNYQLSNT